MSAGRSVPNASMTKMHSAMHYQRIEVGWEDYASDGELLQRWTLHSDER